MSGFSEATSLGKYLGVPLVGRAPKRSDYNYLINQVKMKLSTWKAKQLSLAGRITLSKAVIEAIPIYPMMTTSIPKACLHEIQKIQRAFIWGEENGERKYHAVSWDNITKPKAFGGLGIRRLVQMNKACLMKLAWSIRSGEEALWIDVIRGKYSRGNSNFNHVVSKSHDSNLWKNLVNIWNSFNLYEFWTIGNGSKVRAWDDKWLYQDKSIQDFGIMIPESLKHMMVNDLVDTNGGWRFDLLIPWLPSNIISKFHAIMAPSSDSNEDMMAWSGTANGEFSIASAYTLLCRFNDDAWEADWLQIWRLRVPERIRTFIWIIRHDRLLTNYRKSKMHISEPWCNHCVDVVEDTLHVLRDCPLAKSVWCNLLNGKDKDWFFTAALDEWIILNMKKQLGRDNNLSWASVWATSCHFLWLWRNRETHGDSRLRPLQPWKLILKWVMQYFEADVSGIVIANRQKVEITVTWQCPEDGWLSLNTDGASRGHTSAGCGGLLRNSEGQWLGGFSRNLGRCNAYIAELWGVHDGLCLARDKGAKKLKVYVDSSVVVHTLNSTTGGSVVGWRLIQEIRRLLALDWEIKVCHSYREANACADALANMGCDHGPGIRVYEQCPSRLSLLLLADTMGITTPRVIVV
ncbi:ribonuclease H [Trifolium pratense]|uniref:Ribonuclease H n=1 Tax=Trifolium pratense TaxID=57577 RepID=A0A2K3LSU0_TRIPR|nr:ribonuclease H [Trifolium pratense]